MRYFFNENGTCICDQGDDQKSYCILYSPANDKQTVGKTQHEVSESLRDRMIDNEYN